MLTVYETKGGDALALKKSTGEGGNKLRTGKVCVPKTRRVITETIAEQTRFRRPCQLNLTGSLNDPPRKERTMAEFELSKAVDEIQEATPLPPEWYLARLVQEPKLEDNAKMKAGGADAEGAGQNLVLRVRVQDENPEFNGRQLTKWLSWPNEKDEGEFTGNGQPKVDWKMESIVTWCKALGGDPSGNTVSFTAGSECYVYVVQEEYNGELRNSIDMNSPPKAA